MRNQPCQYEATTLKYLAGHLPNIEIYKIESHIAQCVQCCEIMAQLSRLTVPVETAQEKAFLDANVKDSEIAVSKLIANNLNISSTNIQPTHITKYSFLPNRFSVGQKIKFLALVASLAILLLIGDRNFLIWQTPSNHLDTNQQYTNPVVPTIEKPRILEQINQEGRITEFRLTGLSYAHFIKSRGIDSTSEIEGLVSARLRLETSININPTPSNRQILAQILFMLKEYDLAIAQLSQASLESPTNQSIYNDLAIVTATKQDYKNALLYVNKALTIKSNDLVGIFNRALIYNQLKDYDSARSDWEEYLRLDSSSQWAEEVRNNLNSMKNQPL